MMQYYRDMLKRLHSLREIFPEVSDIWDREIAWAKDRLQETATATGRGYEATKL